MSAATRTDCDVLVIGGGPAGTSTAVALAREGFDVVLVDRARFPRPKPCAEYLSPEASRILDAMGALSLVQASGAAQLTGAVVRAPNGAILRGEFRSAHGYRPYSERGLSVRREVLDHILVERARASGVRVVEEARVTGLVMDGSAVIGASLASGVITGGTPSLVAADTDQPAAIRARFVVGADGLNSLVAKRVGVARRARWPRRIALVTHFANVQGLSDVAEMHVEPDGFIGIADVGHGLATAALVVPATFARAISADRETFMLDWIHRRSQLRDRFALARRVSPVRATGPFASKSSRAWFPGGLLVGDAADFFDPFTGEGIFAALHGGELAADAIRQHSRGESGALRDYDRARRAAFGGKWIVERVVGAVVGSPFLMNRVGSALARRRDLADLLIGVTGDFVPPREVVNARFVLAAFGITR